MDVRKIFKAGNSYVVSLPSDMMKSIGLSEGSHLTIDINREQRELILKPIVVKKSNLSVDFVRLVDKVLIDYENAVRRLAE